MIELTPQQREALQGENPPALLDPQTQETYVLVRRDLYDRVEHLLKGCDDQTVMIAPGIVRSQQTFWWDLPQLLAQKKLRGQWVCYRGNERLGIGNYEGLIRDCVRRGLSNDEYDLFVIEPHAIPPWEPEEIDSGGHEVDDEGPFEQDGRP